MTDPMEKPTTTPSPTKPTPAPAPAPTPPKPTPAPAARSPILQFFAYSHLPPHLQDVSSEIAAIAERMESILPASAEKSAGLRKLLEAKDCFVRARLEK